MNYFRAVSFALFALLVSFVAFHAPQSAHAQTPKPAPVLGKTFLEGMALDDENVPLYKQGAGLAISVRNREGEQVYHALGFQSDLGGLYRIELEPGIYDIFISRYLDGKLRPLRLNGVRLIGGKINKLNITMRKGEALETIGEPIEPTIPATIISKKFAEMQKLIDDLKAQVKELKKKK